MKVHHLLGARRVAGVLSLLLLAACSSGGGGDEQGRSAGITLSTNSVAFAADAPDADTPETQVVTATFGENVVHLAVIHTSNAIANITTSTSGRTAQISIAPAAPSDLGSGIFQATIAVTGYFCADAGCTSLAAGDTEQIRVTYQISPVILAIAPYVATANESGTAIIRGVGFASFATQGVRFGDTAATEFVLISDQEIRVTYPALPAGTYPVQIDIPDHIGDLQSEATLVVVEPTAYPAQALAYPSANPTIREILYDAERRAILLATDSGGGSLVRFAYGASDWEAPTSAAVNGVQDIALSTRGERLLAVTPSALALVNPTSLATTSSIDAPDLGEGITLRALGVLNDDRALITTGRSESSISALYLYSGRQATLTPLTTGMNNATPAATATGSTVIFTQGHSSTTTALAVLIFNATTGQFDSAGITLTQNAIPPVVDRVGTRAVLNGTNVYGPGFDLLGTLPTATAAVAVKPDGKRAYTYEPSVGVRTFDISADRHGEAYAALGSPVPLVGDPGANPRMTISPDGTTLFIAGSTQLIVQPVPSL